MIPRELFLASEIINMFLISVLEESASSDPTPAGKFYMFYLGNIYCNQYTRPNGKLLTSKRLQARGDNVIWGQLLVASLA